MEVGGHVVQSILEIRRQLTKTLHKVDRESVIGASIVAMRTACRKFLDDIQGTKRRRFFLDLHFMMTLGELRCTFGIHVARISSAYKVDVEGDLASILPDEQKM